ncbi:nuclear autoantigenic sperm protein homolog [Drosophila bipectinata]|uniref:nuclear autoantigenic sperm protein homolog n=1 Tax=Drosophila bipectinata TaxID=42026 RepID=UPI001C898657|nr:protein NASP homolog [Drosophila bipectinata]
MSAEAEAIATKDVVDATPISKPVSAEPVAADTTPDNPLGTTEGTGKAEQERAEKILKGKELFSQGSRNFLVKSYDEAADELSQVCQLYEEVYGELADELGQPLLLYAKALIAMALDENKVIDVPDEAADEDDEDVDDDEEEGGEEADSKKESKASNGAGSTNGKVLDSIKEASDEADSTGEAEQAQPDDQKAKKPPTGVDEVSSSNGGGTSAVNDDERPSTSNGEATTSGGSNGATATGEEEGEEEEGVSGSLQLAWEILEAAAKIFSRQGLSGLPYLAEVQTELANIEFENGILEAAREDYEKALKIHGELPNQNRRALAELHYKIGLTYLMQQLNKEGAAALRQSSSLIEEEIAEIKAKDEPSERERNNMLDLEETKQEILAKIQEIEEMQAQTIAEVRAALDSYIKPMSSGDGAAAASSTSSSSNGAASSSSSSASGSAAASSSAISSSSAKPTDITHLIKRKKPEEPSSEAEALCSPAKRPAV